MRALGAITFSLFLAAGLWAQKSGQPVPAGTGGSAVHPAGNLPGTTRITPSAMHPGGGGLRPINPGQNNRGVGARGWGAMAYPVYIGGYYDSSYIAAQASSDYQQQQPQPNITIVMPEQTPAPVIINNYYPGATTDNPNAAPTAPPAADDAAPASQPSHYLIAYKDHTIYAAVAYRVDGGTLHYFTAGNTHNQVSLTLVDRDLTARLNKEAGVEVTLPAPSK